MPTKNYALKTGEPERLEISWKGAWKNLTVRLDGSEIGSVANQEELKAGKEFSLGDGSPLKIQLVRKLLTPELQLLRDGQPLPGSASDPTQRLRVAYRIVFFVAGLNIVLGFVTELFQISFLTELGLGLGSIIFGVFFAVLGFFVKRRSMVALGAAVGLFLLDGILAVVLVAEEGGRPPVGGIIARLFLMVPMIQGFGAIRALRKAQ